MKLTLLCENCAPVSFGITAEHGFSALLETGEKNILFDTGQGVGLINNAKLLGVDLSKVDMLVLSHGHKDHTGGIPPLLELNAIKTVVAHPACFENKFSERKVGEQNIRLPIGIPWSRQDFERKGVKLELADKPLEIAEGVWFSGEIPKTNDFEKGDPSLKVETSQGFQADPFKDDASLFVRTEKGLSVITGCAHRGIVNIVTHAFNTLGKLKVHALIGGLHLMNADRERMDKTIDAMREFNPKIVCAGHCTGLESASLLKQAFGDIFQFMSVGQRFEL